MVKDKIIEILQKAVKEDLKIHLEQPEFEKFGDYSTSIAMMLAKSQKKNPLVVAEEIVKNLPALEEVEKIEIVKPGFINFHLKKEFLLKELETTLKEKENFGASKLGKGKKVVLEHTNVNPNKALHVGHLRNACLGSSVEKILETIGYDVEVQNYIDDTGVQVATTVLGLRELDIKQEPNEKFDHYALRVYVATEKALETNPELKKKQEEIIHALDKRNGEIAVFTKELSTKILYENLKTTHDFNIDYDLLPWESDILERGFWKEAFEVLKKTEAFEKFESGEKAGCWVVKNVLGDDKVIVKSNGVVTYAGKDIAYHLWKFNVLGKDFLYKEWENPIQEKPLWTTCPDGKPNKNFGQADVVVNFIDVRQTFPQQAVREGLKMLGFEKQAENLHHIGYGIVSLSPDSAKELGLDTTDNKNQYAMSGRKGITILADDLLEKITEKIKIEHPDSPAIPEIAIGAIKYYMLNYTAPSDLIFDYKKALDIYGNTGPYLQYAYARCANILEKAKSADFVPTPEFIEEQRKNLKPNEEEFSILRELRRFPEAVEKAGENFEPRVICEYLFELAQRFNTFYNKHRVLNAETDELKSFRLILTQAVAQTLKNGLNLLGISAPTKV